MTGSALSQVLTAAQMQRAEEILMQGDDTVDSLMERAGAGAADWIWRLAAGRPVSVLCGPGNNGGDGYVIARKLSRRGIDVSVVAPLEPKTDAARRARESWGGELSGEASGSVFVDCLFGTGLGRPLCDDLLAQLQDLASRHELRVAVDLPSGVNSDTGEPLNDGLPHYDLTVALGAWKRAHWLMPASAVMGARRLFDIGVRAMDGVPCLSARPKLSGPSAAAHKYSRGLAAIVAGEMTGAALLSARAAQHSGAGYVKLLSPHSHPALPADLVLVEGADIAEELGDERINAVLVGPGLGRSDAARQRLEQVMASSAPKVLDADALTLLRPAIPYDNPGDVLATPHAGELDTLCKSFGIVASGKLEQAMALHQSTGFTILAKGPDNVLAGPEGVRFFPPASAWLSTAGTGDALAGIAVSRMACGQSPFAAAEQAVHIHAEAARLAGPAFSADRLVDMVRKAYAAFL